MGLTTFRDIIGQTQALREIKASFAADRLNHAYLLEGAAGVGKYTLAQAMAARYLCLRPTDDNTACGECTACKMLRENNHPDFLALSRKGRYLPLGHFAEREGSAAEKADHEPVLTFMRYKPLLEHGRVCIIPEAERMQEPAANAFLKTLEEPPPHSLFILTTAARERIIGTIVSRCRRVVVAPLPAETLRTELERRQTASADAGDAEHPPLSGRALEVIAQLAEGSLGTAVRLTAGDVLEDWKAQNDAWKEFTPAAAVGWAETVIGELAACKNPDEKRARLLYWLDFGALKVRRLWRHGEISALGAAEALEAFWTGGERLNANVRPELIALTVMLAAFAAMRGTAPAMAV